MRGKIRGYDDAKGYGFIKPEEDLKSDIHFRSTVIAANYLPKLGDLVEFDLKQSSPAISKPGQKQRCPEASRVSLISGQPQEEASTVQVPEVAVRDKADAAPQFPIPTTSGLGQIRDEISLLRDTRTQTSLVADFDRLKALFGTGTFDARRAAANFQQRLASALFDQSSFAEASQRARAAFDGFGALRTYHRFKKSLSSCAQLQIQCIIDQAQPEVLQDVPQLVGQIKKLLKEMFNHAGVIPRELFVRVSQLVLRAAEQQRIRLVDDSEALEKFIARSYPSLCQLPTGPSPELRHIKEQWRMAAENLCPEIAEELAFSSTVELGLQLGQHIDKLLGARKHPTCEMPEALLSTLRTITDHVTKESTTALETILQPVEPLKQPVKNKKRMSDLFEQAMAQISDKNFDDAEETLNRALAKEPTSAPLWEWIAYVHLRLGMDDLAESNLRLAPAYGTPDENTRWNTACAFYRRDKLEDCLKEILQCGTPDATRAALALALRLGRLGHFLDKLASSDDLRFFIVGVTDTISRKDYSRTKEFLDHLTKKLRALQDPFQPLPYEEQLDDEDVTSTLAYFLQYDQLEEGIRHFQFRLDRNQRPNYALLRALGQLLDHKDRVSEALSCFRQECDITMASKAPLYIRIDCLTRVLDFCVRRQKRTEGLKLLSTYGTILDSENAEQYEQKFEAEQQRTDRLDLGVVEPPKKHGRDSFSSDSAEGDQATRANARLAELNRKYGTINNIFHVKQARSDLHEYCEHLKTIYGQGLAASAETANSVIDHFCVAAEATNGQMQREAIDKARVLLTDLDKSLSGCVQDTKHELVVLRKLKLVLGDAYVRMGLVSHPLVEILNESYPEDRPETTLFFRVRNVGQVPIDRIYVAGNSQAGVIRLLDTDPVLVGPLDPGESQILGMRVSKQKEGAEDILFVSTTYEVGEVEHPNPPAQKFTISLRPFTPVPLDRYIVGSSVPVNRPENFHGREEEINNLLEYIEAAGKGTHGVIFLDGIKQVGKSSILNFIRGRLQSNFVSVRLSMIGKDLPSTPGVLHMLAREVCTQVVGNGTNIKDLLGEPADYETRPIDAFRKCLQRVREKRRNCKIVLIIDEVQELIKAIADAEKQRKPLDSRVLNAWQAELEEEGLIFVLTGSLRYNMVTKYLGHSFFRRVKRIPIGFLPQRATTEVLTVPVHDFGLTYTDEAIQQVWNLTRGYASVVQRCGLACLEQLNMNGRRIVTPSDIDNAADGLLSDAQLFKWWWDGDILREQEECVMRTFMRLQEETTGRGVDAKKLKHEVREFGSEANVIINTLCDQEILEFSKGKYCVKGALLQEWLSRKFKGEESFDADILKYCVLAIDHENFFINMQKTASRKLGIARIDDDTLRRAIHQLVENVERYGDLALPIVVAVWSKGFGHHRSLYEDVDQRFETLKPAQFRKDASDSEIKRAIVDQVEAQVLGKKTVGTVIVVTGDVGYKELIDRLKKQGRRAIVWAWECSLTKNRELAKSATRFESLDNMVIFEQARKRAV